MGSTRLAMSKSVLENAIYYSISAAIYSIGHAHVRATLP